MSTSRDGSRTASSTFDFNDPSTYTIVLPPSMKYKEPFRFLTRLSDNISYKSERSYRPRVTYSTNTPLDPLTPFPISTTFKFERRPHCLVTNGDIRTLSSVASRAKRLMVMGVHNSLDLTTVYGSLYAPCIAFLAGPHPHPEASSSEDVRVDIIKLDRLDFTPLEPGSARSRVTMHHSRPASSYGPPTDSDIVALTGTGLRSEPPLYWIGPIDDAHPQGSAVVLDWMDLDPLQ